MTEKEKNQREELAELKRKNKELQKELNRKDKALAETAALLALKKSRSDLGGRRGRLIPKEDRALAVELIEEAREAGARLKPACEVLGISIRTFQRWRDGAEDRRKGTPRRIARKLSEDEQDHNATVCCSPEYATVSPYVIYADLLDRGMYLASVSTMYRILRERDLLHHRGESRRAQRQAKPAELKATGPNQV